MSNLSKECDNCYYDYLRGSIEPCESCGYEYDNFIDKNNPPKNDFTKAEIGQELWDNNLKEIVKVLEIDTIETYSILVEYQDGTEEKFTSTGYFYDYYKTQTLFWRKPNFPGELIPDPEPKTITLPPASQAPLTFVNSYHEKHFRMWMWLSLHPDKNKEEYFLNNNHNPILINDCYACEFVKFFNHTDLHGNIICKYCPIQWNTKYNCSCNNSLYNKWLQAKTLHEKSSLAQQIALLPWNIKEIK